MESPSERPNFFDPARDFAAGQSRLRQVAWPDRVGVLNHMPVRRPRQAIAAGEDVERAERFEPSGDRGDSRAAPGRAARPRRGRAGRPGRRAASPVADAIERAAEARAVGDRGRRAAGLIRPVAGPLPQARAIGRREPVSRAPAVGRQVGDRPARRQGPVVGDQVGDRHVGLVADGADDRNPRREDRIGNQLLVERPEVFQAAAAAADDQGVRDKVTVGVGADSEAESRPRFQRPPSPCTRTGTTTTAATGQRRLSSFEHVADGRPGRARDQGDRSAETPAAASFDAGRSTLCVPAFRGAAAAPVPGRRFPSGESPRSRAGSRLAVRRPRCRPRTMTSIPSRGSKRRRMPTPRKIAARRQALSSFREK